ncbi:MAG: hypothetical protein KJ970_03640 [Candidatus Eisenbacteria bacterium]|uniref:Uncharacterized protein n=1 Tax=Eiseniibacteriota bacterium TaxID=2212470 RepID=A0A948W540_UNCEI|nr:hypothetical protein [Candidatus Eisenbacteria bacterium]MBU1947134.1 hypothetical protein [Candidatus Eisenbacteria bacterium]MBU2689994.1 hypothetical protein [Candidatus Eisenbacteria bacterium]
MTNDKGPNRHEEWDPNHDRRFAIIVLIFRTIWLVVKAAVVVAIIYMVFPLSLRETAGKQTVIEIMFNIITNLKLHVVLPAALAAAFGGLWARERRVRKKAVAREHMRVEELEKEKDPDRTSSGLEEYPRPREPQPAGRKPKDSGWKRKRKEK